MNEGSSVPVDGSASSDPDVGDSLTYEWDFNYDGVTFNIDATGVSPSFSAVGLDGPSSVTIGLRVTDTCANTNIATSTVTVNNVAPTANAGGAYSADEGGSVVLDASASSDPGNDISTYEWDFDYDGVTFNVDGSGVGPTFSAAGLDGPLSRTVAVRVTDTAGAANIASSTVTVNNVAPTVDAVVGPDNGVRGQPLNFTDSFTDPAAADTHQVSWDFGDGTVIAFHPSTDPGALTPSHAYAATGVYTVRITVQDDDGGSNFAEKTITITDTGIQSDPLNPGMTLLAVGGTTSADIITLRRERKTGAIFVAINAVESGPFNPTSRISVYGQDGNDQILLRRNIRLNALLDGGAGDDTIQGGYGTNALVGGTGTDLIRGSRGRDLIISGLGNDMVRGLEGEDILIAGSTTHDANDLALMSILAEWSSDRDRPTRVANITGPGTDPRLNGPYFLNGSTVTMDGAGLKKIYGTNTPDWIF